MQSEHVQPSSLKQTSIYTRKKMSDGLRMWFSFQLLARTDCLAISSSCSNARARARVHVVFMLDCSCSSGRARARAWWFCARACSRFLGRTIGVVNRTWKMACFFFRFFSKMSVGFGRFWERNRKKPKPPPNASRSVSRWNQLKHQHFKGFSVHVLVSHVTKRSYGVNSRPNPI